jgi:hypothetical protein
MNRQNIKQQLRRAFFALAIVGAALTLPSADAGKPGAAAKPVSASGSLSDCECVTEIGSAGPNTIITLSIKATFTGTFTGTWVGTERDVIYSDGSVTIHASGVFTGSVSGKSGTAVLTYIGVAGTASPFPAGSPGTSVNWVADQGTGGLAGLHGEGPQQNAVEYGDTGGGCENGGCDDSFTLDYAGQIQFAP